MVRTQIELEPETFEEVRRIAFSERMSVSAVVRRMIKDGLTLASAKSKLNLKLMAGIGSSGKRDIAEKHDDYLTEDFAR